MSERVGLKLKFALGMHALGVAVALDEEGDHETAVTIRAFAAMCLEAQTESPAPDLLASLAARPPSETPEHQAERWLLLVPHHGSHEASQAR